MMNMIVVVRHVVATVLVAKVEAIAIEVLHVVAAIMRRIVEGGMDLHRGPVAHQLMTTHHQEDVMMTHTVGTSHLTHTQTEDHLMIVLHQGIILQEKVHMVAKTIAADTSQPWSLSSESTSGCSYILLS